MTHLGFSQEFNFYKEENLFGEKMYGLNDGHGLEVTGLKWKKYYNYETSQFGQPIAVVSEYGHNFHFINLQGARTSLFSFPEAEVLEDPRMQYEGDMKIIYRNYWRIENEGNYEYYLNEDCACDPRPYYPCPPRFQMDTTNASEVIKNVQQMLFLSEFYAIDSAVTICN